MTTTEHLEKIKAKCLDNLAIAEKRTAGKWKHNDGHRMLISVDSLHEDPVLYGDEFEIGDVDADFIAACAGAAEAGWHSTIAAIDTLTFCYPDGNIAARSIHANLMAETIIAAWPEEIL